MGESFVMDGVWSECVSIKCGLSLSLICMVVPEWLVDCCFTFILWTSRKNTIFYIFTFLLVSFDLFYAKKLKT